METEFTPVASLVGGALIGAAALLFLAVEGRIAGISGIASRLMVPGDGAWSRNLAFLLGIVAAPLLVVLVTGAPIPFTLSAGTPLLVAGGILVGFGTCVGSGCTSGHGVCGLSRLSLRSLVSVVTFMATAAITVFVVRHLG